MKHLFTFLLLFLNLLVASNSVLAQACTTGCTFTAPSGGTSFDMNGNQLLCITGNVTNLGGNFNGSNNQICLASGVTWTQDNSKNFGSVSLMNVYGNAVLTGASLGAGTINVYSGGTLNLTGGSLNGTTINVNSGGTLLISNNTTFNSPANTINVNSGATFTTSSTDFNNNLTFNNAGAISFTSTSNINFSGATSTFNNAAGATVTATATSLFKFGNGVTVVNNGTMNFSNLENEEAIKFDNNSTGKITVNRSFYNHGAFKNDGLIRTLCASGSGVCEFKVGNKGPGKVYINNACMIVAGNVTFDGPGTLNGTLEVLAGYNVTLNNIVTGSNGTLLVDGGTSTIGAAGQYTGSVGANSMKFYDANTIGHDFDAKNNQNNASTYTVLTSAPATSCSATTSACSVSVAVTNTTCQTATNQYVLTGTVSFSTTGGSTITIQDGTASTTVSTTGTSPQAFTLTGTSLVSNASSHTVTATSSTTACSTTATATYTSPATCLAIAVSSVTVCGGQTATLTATGCIGSVSWSNGATGTSINIATLSSITSTTVLSYTATCTSGSSTAMAVATVTVRPTPPTPTLVVVQTTCIVSTGTITAVSVGATSFTLTGPVTVTNTTGLFIGLNPGSYTVTAGNGTGCTSFAVGTINTAISAPVTPTLTVIQPTCATSAGSVTATSAGAISYTLTNGVTPAVNGTGIFTGVAPGSYTIIASNGTCSSLGATVTIIANPGTPVAPTLTVIQPNCTTPTGSLTAVSVGATSFTLTDGVTLVINGTGLFAGLTPGSYTVTAGNGGGCISTIATTAITVAPTAPAMPTVTALCSSATAAMGAISITSPATGPGITYSINGVNYQASNTFTGLAVGSYTVTVQQNGCTSPPASVSVGVCSPPFPVELSSFGGKWIDGVGNQLNWSTAWERANDHFEIQRSATATSFESIGRVVGKGTISTRQVYEFVDTQPVDDITYYRLKQMDTDGKISYSRIIAIDKGESVVTLEVYPNPTTAELSLRVGNRIEEVNVYNNTGHLVLHQVDGKTTLQVSSLSGGVYTVEIKTVTGLIVRQRFIKQ